MQRCQGTTQKKTPCQHKAVKGTYFCTQHTEQSGSKNGKLFDTKIFNLSIIKDKLITIDINRDIFIIFQQLDELRKKIDELNTGYNYNVLENVVVEFRDVLSNTMKNFKRISLITDYMFIFNSRDMTKSITSFDIEESSYSTLENLIKIDKYRFRGFEKTSHPTRFVVKSESQTNSSNPILNLDKVSKDIFDKINETINFTELLDNIVLLKAHIENLNYKYDFYVQSIVIDYVKSELRTYIVNNRRIELIVNYIFIFTGRQFNDSINYYCCNPKLSKSDVRKLDTYLPRNFSSSPFTTFRDTSKPTEETPKQTEAPPPKKEAPPPPPPKKEVPPKKPEPPKKEEPKKYSVTELYLELKKHLKDKEDKEMNNEDIKSYIKICLNTTTALKSLTREEIMALYKTFHPDKVSNNPTTQDLCTLISSKLSVLKKQNSDKGSPVRPMGSFYDDLCKKLNLKV